MQRTPIRTRSQGPAQHLLDPDIDRRQRLSPSDLRGSLEPVPSSTRNRGESIIDPMSQIPDSPDSPSRGRSQSTRRQASRHNPPTDSNESDPPPDEPTQVEEPTDLLLKLLQAIGKSGNGGPKFRTPGMKPPDKFDGETSSKLRGFLQSCKLLFSNDPSTFAADRQKVLYAASYLSGRAAQWFEPYLDLLDNKSPTCILNNWDRFEQQLFTLFGDPNEVRNAEFELNSLAMKENGKASTYISQFRTLQSRVDWNDAAFAFHFRKGLPSRITDQLALTGQRLNTLQQLIDRTIELDNCYHDKVRNNKKSDSSSKQDDASKNSQKSSKKSSNVKTPTSSTPKSSSSKSKIPADIVAVLNKEGNLKADERARREKEGLCMYCGGKHELDTCAKKIAREAAKQAKK
ncbi:uncharacterized protein VP01_204g9 [Puccinia sorghi]|uniref:Ty3 transposon capsid-like protein domain-containing protein n=1 Tax=Puccinia sorghi TaxID=27349 RepID=A0A0L6VB12_9BASI|nr:uncharacterized protein VP01_204g9 [Puccinia sorghi]